MDRAELQYLVESCVRAGRLRIVKDEPHILITSSQVTVHQ